MKMDKIYRYASNPIVIGAMATMIISYYWGLYFMAPVLIKLIFSTLMWVSVLLLPYRYIKRNDFDHIGSQLFKMLLLLSIIQTIRSILNDDSNMHALGNKWITLLGNEYAALLFVPPFYILLSQLVRNVQILNLMAYVYLFIGCWFLFVNFSIRFEAIYLAAFYHYANKKYKILIYIAVVVAIISAFVGENPTRSMLLYVGFGILAYLLVYGVRNIKMMKLFCIVIFIIPIINFIPMLIDVDGHSVFEELQSLIIDKTDNKEMASDTRTFLYREMAEDLTKTDCWLFGKGAYAHYYSFFFDDNSFGKYGRISSEVPFLNMLMHGGIVYTVLYFALILRAVYLGVWRSNNCFCRCIAIIAIGWYFNSFICDLTGARFYHIAFFVLVGCCLSKQWLNMSESEIKEKLLLK